MSDENETNTLENVTNTIFSEVTVTIIIWFLAIYILISAGLAYFDSEGKYRNVSFLIKTLDLFLIVLLTLYLLISYYSLDKTDRSEFFTYIFRELKDFLNNGMNILYLLIIQAVFYGIAYIFGLPLKASEMTFTLGFVVNILWTFFALVLIVLVLNLLNIPIVDFIYYGIANLFTVEEEEEENENTGEVDPKGEEVFNISNNLYTYEEAGYMCQGLGARLATYDEIEKAYNAGAEWCNYGWSEDQMAYFPTQKETWRKLQSSEEHKNDCGRPGINGGYMANPNLKFGVNCFGVKPEATQSELDMMETKKNSVLPKSRSQVMADRKIQFWKENKDKMMTINSFNKNNWSRY